MKIIQREILNDKQTVDSLVTSKFIVNSTSQNKVCPLQFIDLRLK